ncbi:hypothetical protein ACPESV_43495, partial [Streptomyces umbrinus]
ALAGATLLTGDVARAAVQLGLGAGLRGISRAHDPDVARIARQAADRLGPDAYRAAYGRGRTMDRSEALAFLDHAPG